MLLEFAASLVSWMEALAAPKLCGPVMWITADYKSMSSKDLLRIRNVEPGPGVEIT